MLVGMVKAFAELEELGWLKNTKGWGMVSVQAEGCAPGVKAVNSGGLLCDVWLEAHRLASGLGVRKSLADHLIVQEIYESEGTAVAVSDESILEALEVLARMEGIFAAREGVATLAAVVELIENKWVHRDGRIVLFNTGVGVECLSPPISSPES